MSKSINTWVLRNRTHYIVFPNCPENAARVMESLARQLYPKELSQARLSKREITPLSYSKPGILRPREILG